MMNNSLKHLQNVVKRMFGLDKRSLALYRFFLGIAIIGELIWRSFNLRVHYTNEGLMTELFTPKFFLTVHALNKSVTYQAILFIIHGILAIMFSIGFKTKLVTFLLYILTTSLNNYATHFNCSGDVLNNALLLFVMFLPVGEVWSVDSAMKVNDDADSKIKNDNKKDNIAFNFASVGFIFQLQAMYIFTTFYKTGRTWRVDYTATYFALQLLYFRLPFGQLLLKLPMFILKILTYGVFKWELYGPLFYTFPIYSEYLRMIGVLGFLLLHLGFGLSLALGTFMWMPMISTLALIPSLFWDKIFEFLKTENRVFDVVVTKNNSSFAYYLGQVVNNFLLLPYTKTEQQYERKPIFSSYYSEERLNKSEDDDEVFISVKTDYSEKTLKNTSALMHILLYLCPITSPLLRLRSFIPKSGNRILEFIFSKLHTMTKYQENDIKKMDINKKIHKMQSIKQYRILHYMNILLSNLISLMVIILILYLNLAHTGIIDSPQARAVSKIAKIYSLDQPWRMFSPNPPPYSFCPLIMGTLANNQTVDLFRGGAVTKGNWKPYLSSESHECPSNLGEIIGDVRWYKFFEVQIPNEFRYPLGRYICSNFNRENTGQQKLVQFDIKYLYFETKLNWTRELADIIRIFGFDCTRNQFI